MEAVESLLAESLLIEIFERSALLSERHSDLFEPAPEANSDQDVDRLWTAWADQSPRGNPAFFANRLQWDGLGEGEARRRLARPCLRERFRHPSAWPDWLGFLEQCLNENAALAESLAPENWQLTSAPIPFEEILTPFVRCAYRLLASRAGALLDLLAPAAGIALERQLASTLSKLAERALYADFSAWRLYPEFHRGFDSGRPLYSSYVLSFRLGGLEAFLRTYPVLARMLSAVSLQWVECGQELLERLAADRDRLRMELFENPDRTSPDLGRVAALQLGISDRHHRGRTVMGLVFESGAACYYKPRSIRPEAALNGLLQALAVYNPDYALETYRVIECEGYGWCRSVEISGCEDADAVRRFLFRCGLLTGVLYALEASDCNFENILVSRDCPVLIDAETLLQPRPAADEADAWKALQAATEELFYDSVLRLHILPRWTARPDGGKSDISGFGTAISGRGTIKRRVWEAVNSDRMTARIEQQPTATNEIVDRAFDGRHASLAEITGRILAGFEAMYRLLMSRRDELWAPQGPMLHFAAIRSRIIVRDTHTYVGLLDRLCDPKALTGGAQATLALDALAKLFADSSARPEKWDLVGAEMESLIAANVPSFHAPATSTSLELGSGKYIAHYFQEPAVDLMRRRFFAMSEADLDLQKRYIRTCFGNFALVAPGSGTRAEDQLETCAPQVEEFDGEAVGLARSICSLALRAKDGSVSWITQTYNADSQFLDLHPIGFFFYDGIGGIALFLSALNSCLGTDEFEEVNRAILSMLSAAESPRMRSHLARAAVGAGLGTASLAYCLLRAAGFRRDQQLLDLALGIARRMQPETIHADKRLDLIGGSAGCLMVLRALSRVSDQPWLREKAIQCGEHLLASRAKAPTGHLAWRTIRGNFLAGYSHGAAGIAAALSELYEWTGEPRYRQAVVEAFDYERCLLDRVEGNWPNLLLPRKEGGYEFWNAWCHGAPGIGLARLAAWNTVGAARVREDLEICLKAAAEEKLNRLDMVCCGNLGRIDLLLETPEELGREAHRDSARQIAAAVVRRARGHGEYACGVRQGIAIPSFHQGLSGIGYQLLRVSRPDRLPSVMRWN